MKRGSRSITSSSGGGAPGSAASAPGAVSPISGPGTAPGSAAGGGSPRPQPAIASAATAHSIQSVARMTRPFPIPSCLSHEQDRTRGVTAVCKRKPGRSRVFLVHPVAPELHRLDFVGLQALLALHDLEGDLLAFLQGLEAGALDRTEVDEDVLAVLRGDEAEALGVVEPLDGTGLTIRHAVTPWKHSVVWNTARALRRRDCLARGNAKAMERIVPTGLRRPCNF